MLIPFKALPPPKIRLNIYVNIDYSGLGQPTCTSQFKYRIMHHADLKIVRKGHHFSLYTRIDFTVLFK